MEFITVEQFQEQPGEIQKIFLDWWKCDYGDLYYYNEDPLEYKDFEIINSNLECDLNGNFDYFKSLGVIPIFAEAQLRKFIEDKTEFPIEKIELIENQYDIYTRYKAIDNYSDIRLFSELGGDILQSYWKVACTIAKEELNED